jgi:hypothetical protein
MPTGGVSGRRALSSRWARAVVSLTPGRRDATDGHARLSAVRYELGSCGVRPVGRSLTASVPVVAGTDKYTARARAVLALARYYLGLPW